MLSAWFHYTLNCHSTWLLNWRRRISRLVLIFTNRLWCIALWHNVSQKPSFQSKVSTIVSKSWDSQLLGSSPTNSIRECLSTLTTKWWARLLNSIWPCWSLSITNFTPTLGSLIPWPKPICPWPVNSFKLIRCAKCRRTSENSLSKVVGMIVMIMMLMRSFRTLQKCNRWKSVWKRPRANADS